MKIIKKLDLFILRSFLPLFAMTFFIVLFIVLMQFLWRYIDDLVGKGLSVGLLGELFFYAAVTLVPMALPLAILLASLMTFGNLGERSELTAIKASGISLLKVMRPLIIMISGIAVGAFFFQNDVLPKAQVKMWTLLFSMKQKSPEVEIPEGVFYDQIPGYNLFVKSKNRDTGTLYNVMIYDVGRGGDNATILLADSARLAFTKDMKHLYLHLWQGEQFENLREQRTMDSNVPFRRESFLDKEIMIPFDANFTRLDEQGMRNQYVGKNMSELIHTMDSVQVRIDSMGVDNSRMLKRTAFPGVMRYDYFDSEKRKEPRDPLSMARGPEQPLDFAGAPPRMSEAEASVPVDIDSLVKLLSPAEQGELANTARFRVSNKISELEFQALTVNEEKKTIRRHGIELMKKFTLSVACLIFFFIGAPLGAIIRKGGLGTPLVISVLLFLVYYIIDNTGYKMARDGRVEVWIGMWLSTSILLPLGIFVTYKAMNDSAVFNKDMYRNLIRRLFGLKESRHMPLKEVIINEVAPVRLNGDAATVYGLVAGWQKRYPRIPSYLAYWTGKGYSMPMLQHIGQELDAMCVYGADSRDLYLLDMMEKLPVVRPLWIYTPVRVKWLRIALGVLFPLGGALWLLSLPYSFRLQREMKVVSRQTMSMLLRIEKNRTGKNRRG